MTDMNVLVSGVGSRGTGKTTSSAKGSGSDNTETGTDSAAMEFAAILGGWLNPTLGQGQNSALQGSDPAGKEANSGPKNILGLEDVIASLRTITGLQLGLTAGPNQEGNASMIKALSTEMIALSQDKQQEAVTDSGMGSGQFQGGQSPLTELDEYRLVISRLLQDMNGEIQEVSFKTPQVQELLNQVIQGLNFQPVTSGSAVSEGMNLSPSEVSPDLEDFTQVVETLSHLLKDQPSKAQDELKALKNVLEQWLSPDSESQMSEGYKALQDKLSAPQSTVNEASPVSPVTQANSGNPVIQATAVSQASSVDPAIQATAASQDGLVDSVKDVSAKGQANFRNSVREDRVSDSVLSNPSNGQISSENNQRSEKLFHGNPFTLRAEQSHLDQAEGKGDKGNASGNRSDSNPDTGSGGDAPSSLASSGIASQSLTSTASSATVGTHSPTGSDLPAWLQVAQEVQEKVLHQRPAVRELDIQLHPAELGQIKISLTWDNGQVHLHMAASEAATGQVLQNHFSELRETLSRSGVQCGMLQMGLADSGQNFNQGQNPAFSSRAKDDRKHSVDENITTDKVSEAGSTRDRSPYEINPSNRINVTA